MDAVRVLALAFALFGAIWCAAVAVNDPATNFVLAGVSGGMCSVSAALVDSMACKWSNR